MKKILTSVEVYRMEFILNVVLLIVLPLILLGLTFLQLIPFIIFFSFIIFVFVLVNEETLKRIRYIFSIGVIILMIFILIAIYLLKSPGLESLGGLAIFIKIAPIFIVGLIGLFLTFIIRYLYNFWMKIKLKYLLTIFIIIFFIILVPFTYLYANINFYFKNYDSSLCERQINKFLIEDCTKNLAILSNDINFCYDPNVDKDACLFEIALKNNNLKACDVIGNHDSREYCYRNVNA